MEPRFNQVANGGVVAEHAIAEVHERIVGNATRGSVGRVRQVHFCMLIDSGLTHFLALGLFIGRGVSPIESDCVVGGVVTSVGVVGNEVSAVG